MERKSSIKEIYTNISKDLPELYNTLCSKLGDENPFAKFSIGSGTYVWTDHRYEWHQMISASSFERSLVLNAYNHTKDEVASKIGTKTAEALFTVPDDSYIYYNYDGNDIKILVTGWGFKKPVRSTPSHPEITPGKRHTPISISFVYDKQRLKNYTFGIKLQKQTKSLRTDDNGFFHFEKLEIGDQYVLIDFNNNKDYYLNVIEGKSDYEFDVTKTVTVNILATDSGKPINAENIKIAYNNTEYNITTDTTGRCSLMVPFHKGEMLSASLREQQKTLQIEEPETFIEYVFESPKPQIKADIIVVVTGNGMPSANEKVTIEYCGKTVCEVTNSEGRFRTTVDFSEDEKCKVSIPNYEPIDKNLTSDRVNEFIFRKGTKDVPKVPNLAPHVLTKYKDESIACHYPITVGGTNYITDNNGIVNFSNMNASETIVVIDGLNPDNTKEYKLAVDQDEYVFYVPAKEPQSDVRLTFIDVNNTPIRNKRVRLEQANHVYEAELDENGSMCIRPEEFRYNETISAYIQDWNASNGYDPIPFTLENGETQYVFHERPSKSSAWNIILQVLVVIAIIAILILMWSFIKNIFPNIFNGVYN